MSSRIYEDQSGNDSEIVGSICMKCSVFYPVNANDDGSIVTDGIDLDLNYAVQFIMGCPNCMPTEDTEA